MEDNTNAKCIKQRLDIKVESQLYFSYSSFTFQSVAWELNPVYSIYINAPIEAFFESGHASKSSWPSILLLLMIK